MVRSMKPEKYGVNEENGAMEEEEGEIHVNKDAKEENAESNHNFSWADEVE
ncbi:hypothetical protein Tco_1397233, partial [Tanacetum coccineum]